jgi:DNA-binding NtrC family response regulator
MVTTSAKIQEARFRADLMDRIRVVPRFLAPLRERDGDVLAWHFVEELDRGGLRRVERIDEAELRGEPPPENLVEQPEHDARTIERDAILAALRRARGKRTEAADLLGMSRTTRWRKMRELGV